MYKIFIVLLFVLINLNAKTLKDPATIFAKKCAMCHTIYGPESMAEKKAMVAPYMMLAMRSVVIGVDAIEEPKNMQELKQEVVKFLNTYLMNPVRDESFCEDIIFQRFGVMPSMKGFITPEELQQLTPWIFDQFSPKDYLDQENY